MDHNAQYIYKCSWCSKEVDLTRILTEASETARWGAFNILQTYGTICDDCYNAQEKVR